jgi:hypothetical protein
VPLSKSERHKIGLHHLLLENLRVYRGFRILSLTVRSLLGPDVGGDLEDVPHQDQDPLQDELVILQPLVPVFPQQVAKDKKCRSILTAFNTSILQPVMRIRIALMPISTLMRNRIRLLKMIGIWIRGTFKTVPTSVPDSKVLPPPGYGSVIIRTYTDPDPPFPPSTPLYQQQKPFISTL